MMFIWSRHNEFDSFVLIDGNVIVTTTYSAINDKKVMQLMIIHFEC